MNRVMSNEQAVRSMTGRRQLADWASNKLLIAGSAPERFRAMTTGRDRMKWMTRERQRTGNDTDAPLGRNKDTSNFVPGLTVGGGEKPCAH